MVGNSNFKLFSLLKKKKKSLFLSPKNNSVGQKRCLKISQAVVITLDSICHTKFLISLLIAQLPKHLYDSISSTDVINEIKHYHVSLWKTEQKHTR